MKQLSIIFAFLLFTCSNPVAPSQGAPEGSPSSYLDYVAPVTPLTADGLPGGSVVAIGAHGKMDTVMYVDSCWIFTVAMAVEFSMGRGTGWYNMHKFIYEVIETGTTIIIIDPGRYFACWYYRVIIKEAPCQN